MLYFRYYPYHYAPFASDFQYFEIKSIDFNQNSKPFTPLEQLLCLTPIESIQYLPKEWQSIVSESFSPMNDFNPSITRIDPNGKRYKSQYTALLPFINEHLVHTFLEENQSSLTSEEKKCNESENDFLFIHSKNPHYNYLKDNLNIHTTNNLTKENPLNLSSEIQIPGYVWSDNNDDKIISVGETVKDPISNYANVFKNKVICVKYSI